VPEDSSPSSSSSSSDAGGGDAWADETTFHPMPEEGIFTSAIAAVRAMETAVEASGLD
jgi:hypothetical protein